MNNGFEKLETNDAKYLKNEIFRYVSLAIPIITNIYFNFQFFFIPKVYVIYIFNHCCDRNYGSCSRYRNGSSDITYCI